MANAAKKSLAGCGRTCHRGETPLPRLIIPTQGPDLPPDGSRCKACRKFVSGTSEDPKIVVQHVAGSVYCKTCCGSLVPADPFIETAREQIQDIIDRRSSLPPMLTDEDFPEYRP